MHSSRFRPALIVGAGLSIVMLSALPATAHVSVSSPDASPGGFGKLVLRVPSESDTASTTKLTVSLPTDTPFAFVSTKVMPGWTVERTTEKLDEPVEAEGFTISEAVSEVTWTADKGEGIGPGEFDEFELSVGPFPDTSGPLTFPTVQTYSDGEVAQWDQPMKADGSEPEHPAPQLTLAASDADAAPDAHAGDGIEETAADVDADESDADATARTLGGAGLVLGAIAVGFAAMAWRNTRASR